MVGAYQPLTGWKSVQSKAFLWCIAEKDGRQYMLKRFMAPRWSEDEFTTEGILQRNQCSLFEQRKRILYRAVNLIPNAAILPITDFFLYQNFFYSSFPVLKKGSLSLLETEELSHEEKRRIAAELALVMLQMHEQGIIHGDFRPEHVYLSSQGLKLTDFDCAFLMDDPPEPRNWLANSKYMAPEVYDYRTHLDSGITTACDRFSFGLLLHRFWTGEEPKTEHGVPIWQVIRSGRMPMLSPGLLPEEKRLIAAMLSLHAGNRPTDAEVLRELETLSKP